MNFRSLDFTYSDYEERDLEYWYCDVAGGYKEGGYRLEIKSEIYWTSNKGIKDFSWGIDNGDIYIKGYPFDAEDFESTHEHMMKFLDKNGIAVHSIGISNMKG